MSSADGSDGADPRFPDQPDARLDAQVDTMLLEALIHVLIEKGVLTRNDALSVVQTTAEVKRGILQEGRSEQDRVRADLRTLSRLYGSFEALADRPGTSQLDGENIFRLRPPLHDDRPEFPGDD